MKTTLQNHHLQLLLPAITGTYPHLLCHPHRLFMLQPHRLFMSQSLPPVNTSTSPHLLLTVLLQLQCFVLPLQSCLQLCTTSKQLPQNKYLLHLIQKKDLLHLMQNKHLHLPQNKYLHLPQNKYLLHLIQKKDLLHLMQNKHLHLLQNKYLLHLIQKKDLHLMQNKHLPQTANHISLSLLQLHQPNCILTFRHLVYLLSVLV